MDSESAQSDVRAKVPPACPETDVAHLRADESEARSALRYVHGDLDGLAAVMLRIDGALSHLIGRAEALADRSVRHDASIDALGNALAKTKARALILWLILAALNLGALAHGLGWL